MIYIKQHIRKCGYNEGKEPCKFSVILNFATHRKTHFFVISLFRVDLLVNVEDTLSAPLHFALRENKHPDYDKFECIQL